MKVNLSLTIIAVLVLGSLLALDAQQQNIVEEVSVNWWQVPVFAIDKNGDPVSDLTEEDIEIKVNNTRIRQFTFIKRSFTDIRSEEGERQEQRQEQRQVKKPQAINRNVVFLLFDNAVSGEKTVQWGKEIARKIVMGAGEETRFIIMSIEPYAGLTYVGDVKDNRDNKPVWKLIDKGVTRHVNKRYVDYEDDVSDVSGPLSIEEYRGRQAAASQPYFRRIFSFFEAFDKLYFLLNSVQGKKFVYLFSEGISNSVVRNTPGGRSMFNEYLGKAAKKLGRSGAVLFIINPMGVDDHTSSLTTASQIFGEMLTGMAELSGEGTLKYLAKQSGGTYMEGQQEKIVRRIENIHRAYYEIAFPDIPNQKSGVREITINSKRAGVKLLTQRSVEKKKNYADMEPVEKELLALNLINPNPLISSRMPVLEAAVENVEKSDKKIVYNVKIPGSFLNKSIDIYKIQVGKNMDVIALENENVTPGKDNLKIEFNLVEKEEIGTYFVMVNRDMNTARAHGFSSYEEDPEIAAKKNGKGQNP